MDRRTALQGLIGIAAMPRIASAVPRSPTRTADVIVVGAGFAGLAAAKALRAAGVEPLVLEARDRVGGRTCPGSIAGLTIDLGGMWVGPTQTTLDALAREYGVETYPQYITGKSAIELNGKWRSSEGEDYGALLSLPVKLDVAQLVYRLTALSDSINPDSPWTHPKAEAFDAMTLQTWLDAHTHTEGARSFMVSLIRAVFCAEPADLSFLFCLFYLRSGGNLEELTTVRKGAQQRLFVGGVHQLSQRMADQLGERVLLNSPVTDIEQDAGGVTVTCPDSTFKAKVLIVAIAPALAGKISYSPLLPHKRDALTQRMPMGSAIKVWIAYASPFWRAHGFSGLYSSDTAAFGPAFDVTPPGTSSGIIAGFFDAKNSVEWSARSSEQRRAEVIRCLTAAFGPQAQSPLEYVEKNWTEERYSLGCYTGTLGPGALTQFGPTLREPVERIFFAGTESSPIWAGYIEGALRSGARAAAEVRAYFSSGRAVRTSLCSLDNGELEA
jgi:monoamine oxidase